MKVNIDLLNLKTVDEAIKQIEAYQKRVANLIPDFLKACAEAIRDKANERLLFEAMSLGLSGLLLNDITSSWETEQTSDSSIILRNTSKKAVYIEFGVGTIGGSNEHTQASEAGYKYDMNAHGDEGWTFWVRNNEIDIGTEYRESEKTHRDGTIEIHTQGQPATMFLYQSAMDFFEVDKGHIRIWKELTKEL